MKSACFGLKPFETLKHQITGKLDTQSRNITTSDPSTSCRHGQFWSWKVTSSVSEITFDRDQLKRGKHHDVFRPMIRIDWYAIWPFPIMSLTLGQIFKITF